MANGRSVRLGATLVAAGLLFGAVGQSTAAPAPGHVSHGTYQSAAGARAYRLFVPSAYHGQALPLVVELPGCTETADVDAARSRFDSVAERLHFLVVYPQQDANANGSLCWNWFLPEDQHRDAGEPAIIAGLTRWVQQRYHADRERTYVMGISAGGAMSEIMAATYPDLYAAAGVYAGCTYRGLPCVGAASAVPPQQSAQWVLGEGGKRAHVTPVFVVQGDLDELVPYPNSEEVVQEHLFVADLLAGRTAVLPHLASSTQQGQKPGGQSYTVERWGTGTGTCTLAVRWTVHGMAHQWSDAPADTGDPYRDTILNDPAGPDVTTPAARFLLAQRLHARTCAKAADTPILAD